MKISQPSNLAQMGVLAVFQNGRSSQSLARAENLGSMLTLPSNLQDVADVIGIDATLAIARHAPKRSRCVSVPKRASVDHWLPKLIGAELFARLQRAYGGDRFFPSRGKLALLERDAEIVSAFRSGSSVADLAETHRLTREMIKLIVDPARDRKRAQRAERDARRGNLVQRASPSPGIGSSAGGGAAGSSRCPDTL